MVMAVKVVAVTSLLGLNSWKLPSRHILVLVVDLSLFMLSLLSSSSLTWLTWHTRWDITCFNFKDNIFYLGGRPAVMYLCVCVFVFLYLCICDGDLQWRRHRWHSTSRFPLVENNTVCPTSPWIIIIIIVGIMLNKVNIAIISRLNHTTRFRWPLRKRRESEAPCKSSEPTHRTLFGGDLSKCKGKWERLRYLMSQLACIRGRQLSHTCECRHMNVCRGELNVEGDI